MDPGAGGTGIPAGFIAIFVVFGLISVGMAIWRFSVLRSGGLNPFVAKEQLEARLNQSQFMTPSSTPPTSTEQRLAELEDLHRRGVISDEELAAGRTKAIEGD